MGTPFTETIGTDINSLLKRDDNAALDTTLHKVGSGDGSDSPLYLATDKIGFNEAVDMTKTSTEINTTVEKVANITVTQAVDLDTIETNSNASKVKTDFITITQPVDLDSIETRVNELDASVILKGIWDASAGTFPGSGVAQAGWAYIVSVTGTVDSITFAIGDRVIAILDNASTTTFASNWFKEDYTDSISSVQGTSSGAIVITDANLSTSDVTTNNASASKHGFLNKLSNVSTEFMNGQGNWTTPSGGGGTILVVAASLSGTQTNYAISGVSTASSEEVMLRITPTASFKFQSLDTTSWVNGKKVTIANVSDPLGAGARMILFENQQGASGTKFSYSRNGVPLILLPGDRATLVYNSTSGFMDLFSCTSFGGSPRDSFDSYSDFTSGGEVVSTTPLSYGDYDAVISTGGNVRQTAEFLASPVKAIGCARLDTLANAGSNPRVGTGGYTNGLQQLVGGIGCMMGIIRGTPLTNLSGGGETYIAAMGFNDQVGGAAVTDGVYWKYDSSAASVWRTCTIKGSSEDVQDESGFTVSVSTMPYLGSFLNGDGTLAEFFYSIDGDTWTFSANVHNTASKIPTTTSNAFAFLASIRKTGGTTSRQFCVDLMGHRVIQKRGA